MKQCIICKQLKEENEFNKEHIIPESIGGSLTIKDVCKECNSKLGNTIDKEITKDFLIKGELVTRRIENKNQKEKVLFPKLINKTNSKIKLTAKRNLQTGKFVRYESNTALTESKPNYFTITYDSSKTEQENLKEITKLFKTKYNKTLNNQESEYILDSIKNKSKPHEENEFIVNEKINFIKLSKEFIKIGYETAYYILGNPYLNDPCGQTLLESLIKKDSPILSKYAERGLNLIGNPECKKIFNDLELLTQKPLLHLIFIFRDKNKIYIHINLFNTISNTILITENANLYNFNEPYFIALYYEKTDYPKKDNKWFEEFTLIDLVKIYIESENKK